MGENEGTRLWGTPLIEMPARRSRKHFGFPFMGCLKGSRLWEIGAVCTGRSKPVFLSRMLVNRGDSSKR